MTKAVRIRPNVEAWKMDIVHYSGSEELHALVGGWLEAVRTPSGNVIYLDGEGRLKGLPRNDLASVLWCGQPGQIMGTVIVVGPTGPDGEDTDVPSEAVQDLMELQVVFLGRPVE